MDPCVGGGGAGGSLNSTRPHPHKPQPALAARSVGKTLLALLQPLLSDVEPSSRQLTALTRASMARLDTVPGAGASVRSALQLLGFLDDEGAVGGPAAAAAGGEEADG